MSIEIIEEEGFLETLKLVSNTSGGVQQVLDWQQCAGLMVRKWILLLKFFLT